MKTFKSITILLMIFSLMVPQLLQAVVINVPEDIETIQGAIQAAEDGDIVLVAPGEYDENINFLGKAITVTSHIQLENNPAFIEETIIRGRGNTSVVTIERCQDAVLRGFTITNGQSNFGGGINVFRCWEPITLSDLIVTENEAVLGGGIHAFSNGMVIRNVIVHNNVGGIRNGEGNFGAGIAITASFMGRNILENARIFDNNVDNMRVPSQLSIVESVCELSNIEISNARDEGDNQARLDIFDADVEMSHLTIASSVGRAIFTVGATDEWCQVSLENSILWGNEDSFLSLATAEDMDGSITLNVNFCDLSMPRDQVREAGGNIEIGWDNNLNEDPLFINPAEGDFRLAEGSPCIDAGNPDSPNDPDGTRPDMGTYPVERGFIEGFVIDFEDDSPIAGAEISSNLGHRSTSNEDGYFIMEIVFIAETHLTASHIGFILFFISNFKNFTRRRVF